jgi:hypothetical protein
VIPDDLKRATSLMPQGRPLEGRPFFVTHAGSAAVSPINYIAGVIASEAKRSRAPLGLWIASSQSLSSGSALRGPVGCSQ